MTPRRTFIAAWAALAALVALPAVAQDKFITVASTTSTEQSGLFKHILPIFEKKTGVQVRVVALGTGQALDLARRGDADVAFVHARAAEEKFVAEGHGVARIPVPITAGYQTGPGGGRERIVVTGVVACFVAAPAGAAGGGLVDTWVVMVRAFPPRQVPASPRVPVR